MLRIALASPYDFAVPGGVNEHVRALARHLRVRGHHVEILAPFSGAAPPDEPGLIPLAATVLSVPFGGSIARISLSPTVWRETRARLAQGHYDVIHLHEPLTPTIGPAALYHSRTLNVGTFHQYRESNVGLEVARPVAHYFTEQLHGHIAVSRAARDFAASYFPGDYQIIPNGIEVADFRAPGLGPLDEYADGRPNILFVGRLEKRKGFRYLLRAFRLVQEALPDVRLLVAGAFEREDRLPYVRYVRHFRIRGVRFIGPVSHAQKIRLFKSAHLFCAPSTGYESFGIVLTEAMASGVPAVASRIAGYQDVVQHGETGVLVPPEDEEALAAALLRLLRDPAERARLAANAARAVERYDWSRVSGEIEDYYHQQLARYPRLARTRDRV